MLLASFGRLDLGSFNGVPCVAGVIVQPQSRRIHMHWLNFKSNLSNVNFSRPMPSDNAPTFGSIHLLPRTWLGDSTTDTMFQRLAPPSIYDPPSLLYTILTQPVKTLIRLLDFFFSLLRSRPSPVSPPLRIVCISDTHCLKTSHIPNGDLLIHAGDLTNIGNPQELQAQIDWLDSLPHEQKIAIAGNHDRYFDPRSRQTLSRKDRDGVVKWRNVKYLQHSSIELKFSNGRELKIYGAPQTPTNGPDDHAFRYPYGSDAWSETVLRDVDILVTHNPPKYHFDLPAALGCEYLLEEVWKVRPTLHVFGHIHSGKTDFVGWLKHGREFVRWDAAQKCIEHALGRPDGFLRGLIDPRSWFDVAKVAFYGTTAVLWDRLWGGQSQEPTLMVLASLMYCNTNQLGNPPQVVDI